VLYPETIDSGEGGGGDDEDVDLEEMLKRELEGIKKQKKSNRFSRSISDSEEVNADV